MDDASRRWVLKSLSPPLHPHDLRSMTGPSRSQDDFSAPDGPALQARPLVVSPDGCDERYPDSPEGSSGSRDGFYSFVEDPMSPEAELNEAWMLSPQRRLHLTTLKEDRAFKVQSYAGGKKTESLFRDWESRYQVQPESRRRAFGEEEEEEKQLRKEIIQKQAPKKKSTFKPSERLGVPDQLDRSRPPNTLTKGFGVSDGPATPEPACPVGLGSIDRAQINFGAARQQFLDLEQGKRDVLVPPWRSRVSRKMEGEHATRSQCGKVETFAENERLSGPSGVLADLGSLAAEACPCSVGGEDALDDGILQATGKAKSDDHDETPIEKEIRLVQEREENLRRARGLMHSEGFSELVEIQSGRVQSLPSPRKAQKKSHGSFALQLESHEKNVSWKAPEEDQQLLLSPCCPHRHAEETSSTPSPTTPPPPPPRHVPSWTTTLSWRSNRESAGLERRKNPSAPDFIEKEIEEALRRERELRESRRSRQSTESRGEFKGSGRHSATPLAERASKVTVTQVDPIERSGPTGAPPSDSEEPRERRQVEDGSYAGIRPVDDINDQVVESTRVIRHKSRRALRWEAGVFANQLQH